MKSSKRYILALGALMLVLCLTSCSTLITNVYDSLLDSLIPEASEGTTHNEDIKNDLYYDEPEQSESIPPESETSNDNSNKSNDSELSNITESTTPTDPQSKPQSPGLPNYPTAPSLDGIDYVDIINTITTDTIKACVNIRTEEFSSRYSSTPAKSSIGSGVIFYGKTISGGYHYYVLTNYHVVELSNEYPYYKYVISDYKGNEYTATANWIQDDNIITLSKKNDLAILEFQSVDPLKVIEMETENPVDYQTLISIGQPGGQRNAITIGSAEGYADVNMGNGSLMKKMLVHDAPIDHGNSGGAILNTDLKLIGINFAGLFENDGSFKCGYGIPIEKVFGFIHDYDTVLYTYIAPSTDAQAA